MIVKIQNRRGQYVDFDPSKLLPGEFAIVQTGDPNTSDGKAIYIGVTAGNVKQLATLDELQSEVETALNEAIPQAVEEATQEAEDAADRAEAAAQTLEIDTTLTKTGQAAEAKATGDALDELNERLEEVLNGSGESESLVPLAYTRTGYYIALDGATADLSNPIASVYGHAYIVADCTKGDQFLVNAKGGGRPRAWGFINSQNEIIDVAETGVTVENLRLTAPTGATKLIINDNSEPNKTSYRIIQKPNDDGIVVRYDVEQNHTEAEKAIARRNIGVDSVSGLSDAIKTALLNCFKNIIWVNGDSENYYNALESALYPKDYPKVTAVYDASHTPFIGDDINTLKNYLTVTYYSESGAQGTILSPNDYILLGNLESNVSRVTVMYDTCTYTFTVNPVDIYNKHTWNYPSDTILHSVLGFSSTNSDIYVVNNHRSLYIDRGKPNAQLLYTNGNLINDGNAFMIPVPDDATKATVTIPSSWVVAFSAWDYSNGRDSRAMVAGTSDWQSGTATITFTARENLVLALSYKLSNNAVITSQDVSAITIVFE